MHASCMPHADTKLVFIVELCIEARHANKTSKHNELFIVVVRARALREGYWYYSIYRAPLHDANQMQSPHPSRHSTLPIQQPGPRTNES